MKRRVLTVQVDHATLARVDDLSGRMSSAWYKAKRTDVLRALLIAGFPAVEARYPRNAARARKRDDRPRREAAR